LEQSKSEQKAIEAKSQQWLLVSEYCENSLFSKVASDKHRRHSRSICNITCKASDTTQWHIETQATRDARRKRKRLCANVYVQMHDWIELQVVRIAISRAKTQVDMCDWKSDEGCTQKKNAVGRIERHVLTFVSDTT
jgi:hypothetical protein